MDNRDSIEYANKGVQKGMHKALEFPIDCYHVEVPLTEPKIIKTDLGIFVHQENEIDAKKSYDVFETIEIIPDIIQLAEKLERTGESWSYWSENERNINLAIEWMKKWGHLNAKTENITVDLQTVGNFYGEYVQDFFQNIVKFYKLWDLYKGVANRDLDKLLEITEVYDKDLENAFRIADNQMAFSFWEREFFHGEVISTYDKNHLLESYQYAALEYLTDELGKHINKGHLYTKTIRRESNGDMDKFNVKPAMAFWSTLDAIYMQFYILLSEGSKKICPVCNKPFVPERKNQKYCPKMPHEKESPCKLTAKSRRYRERFKKKNGFNYWEK